MEKFSKGDWVVEENSAGSIEVVSGVNGWSECGYLCIGIATEGKECTNNKKTRASAHLIAAAPEMYRMLNSVMSEMHGLIDEVNDQRASRITSQTENEPDYHDQETLHLIQVLLAKARGEYEQVK